MAPHLAENLLVTIIFLKHYLKYLGSGPINLNEMAQ